MPAAQRLVQTTLPIPSGGNHRAINPKCHADRARCIADALRNLEETINLTSNILEQRHAFRQYVKACAKPQPKVPRVGEHKYFVSLCLGGGENPNNCGRWFYMVSPVFHSLCQVRHTQASSMAVHQSKARQATLSTATMDHRKPRSSTTRNMPEIHQHVLPSTQTCSPPIVPSSPLFPLTIVVSSPLFPPAIVVSSPLVSASITTIVDSSQEKGAGRRSHPGYPKIEETEDEPWPRGDRPH
jgi:hypothetical protein